MNKYTFSTQNGRAYYSNSILGFIKDFHKESEDLYVWTILIATKAEKYQKIQSIESYPEK